ncbi:MAG: hypothetical protein NVSMB6_13720 [Burkholderiaceae bacterium]
MRKTRLAPEAAGRAAFDLLTVYAGLAERGAHLLGDLLAGAPPIQWERLPTDDAVDKEGRYQWFYHSHAPEDRPAGPEHGHIHLFAKRALVESLPVTADERAFQKLCGNPYIDADTRHLIAIGIDPKGLPISLFTVNSWVTGDLMLGADATAQLLAEIELHTGHSEIDRMIAALTGICSDDIRCLLANRDMILKKCDSGDVLQDRTIEILSETTIDLDNLITRALRC